VITPLSLHYNKKKLGLFGFEKNLRLAMSDINHFLKSKLEQDRSIKAIDDIFETATQLAISGDPSLLNIRELSYKSGYSTGSIYHYFSKIDDLFSYVFNRRREKVHAAFGENILSMDENSTVNQVFEKLVDDSFVIWKQPHPKLLNKMMRQYLKRSKEPEKFFAIADSLVPFFLKMINKNKSGTIRLIEENELRILLRMTQQAIGSPFMEQQPIAGSAEHRKIAVEICCKLFQK